MGVRRARTLTLAGALCLAMATSCTGGDPRVEASEPARAPGEPAPTEAALREDLHAIVAFVEHTHPHPWHYITRERFENAVAALDQRLEEGLSRDAFMVEVMRLLALLGPGDGHTGVFPLEQDVRLLPLRLYRFDDGVFVVDAADPYRELVGSEVKAIAGWSVNGLGGAVASLVPADNQMTVRARVPQFLVVTNILHGLGIIEDPMAPAELEVAMDDGASSVDVVPTTADDYADVFDVWNPLIPPALAPRGGAVSYAHAGEDRWVEVLRDAAAVYVGYHVTLGSTSTLADEVLEALESPQVDRVVLDLRFNPGGENPTYAPLLDALRHPSIDEPGRLLVLVGRSTFSAAGNLATELDVSTSAVFVGERTGFRPDMYGDPAGMFAPNTGLRIEVATVSWDFDGRGPHRPWLEPVVRVTTRSSEYFEGADPVLETALGLVLGR